MGELNYDAGRKEEEEEGRPRDVFKRKRPEREMGGKWKCGQPKKKKPKA